MLDGESTFSLLTGNSDPANFINNCVGKTLTNGLQVSGGSCNGVTMGDIPASTNMISTIMTFPQSGQTIPANEDFTVTIQVANLDAGTFTNPDTTYYAAPQTLSGGNIVGHTHITCQTLGDSQNPHHSSRRGKFRVLQGHQ